MERSFVLTAERGEIALAEWLLSQPKHAIFPGSFNPLHAGHRGVAAAVTKLSGLPIAYELSVDNVDKPSLSTDEIRRRLVQFESETVIVLYGAARMIQKIEQYGDGYSFAIGSDTAWRLVDPRYLRAGETAVSCIASFHAHKARFYVAPRVMEGGKHLGLAGLPPELLSLCIEVPGSWNSSSTAIRRRDSEEVRPD